MYTHKYLESRTPVWITHIHKKSKKRTGGFEFQDIPCHLTPPLLLPTCCQTKGLFRLTGPDREAAVCSVCVWGCSRGSEWFIKSHNNRSLIRLHSQGVLVSLHVRCRNDRLSFIPSNTLLWSHWRWRCRGEREVKWLWFPQLLSSCLETRFCENRTLCSLKI